MKKLTACGLFLLATTVYASWPLEVCGDNNLQLFPSVVKTSNGYITAFVNNNTGGKHCEIYAQRFTDDGEEDSLWNSAVLVSVDTVTYYHGHRLAAKAIPGNTDTAIVAWINHKDYTLCAQKVGPSGSKEWNGGDRPKIITTIAVHTLYTPPEMCSDGAGGAIFVWVKDSLADHPGTANDTLHHFLKATRIDADGGPHTGWPVDIVHVTEYDDDGAPYMPRICADDSGGAMVAWVQVDMTLNGGYGGWIVHLRRVKKDGNLDPVVNVDTSNYDRGYSPIHAYHWTGLNIARGDGYTIVTMKHQYSTYDYSPKWRTSLIEELYVRLVPDVGSMSDRETLYSYTYPGTHYQRPLYERVCYSCVGTPLAAASSDEGAYLAWSAGDWNPGEGYKSPVSHIYVAKIDSDGEATWISSQLSGCYTANEAPQIITQGDTALVVWQSIYRGAGSASRLYYAKFLSDEDGDYETLDAVSSSNAHSFNLVGAGSNSAVVVWNQPGSGTSDWDIYAKKFSF